MARFTTSSVPPPFVSLRDQTSASSTSLAYAGIAAAVAMSDGLVVASRGLNFSIELMSPVSETTTVMLLS